MAALLLVEDLLFLKALLQFMLWALLLQRWEAVLSPSEAASPGELDRLAAGILGRADPGIRCDVLLENAPNHVLLGVLPVEGRASW